MVKFGNTYPFMIRTLNLDLVSLALCNPWRSVFLGWYRQSENTELVLLRVVLCTIPIVKVSKLYEQDCGGELKEDQ